MMLFFFFLQTLLFFCHSKVPVSNHRIIIPDVKFSVSETYLYFTIDPRKNNDDVLIKKIVMDNEKIHLLDKLYSTITSESKKLELIQQSDCDSYPSNLCLKNLFDDWE